MTIVKSILINQTITSIESINEKNTLVISTNDSLYFLNTKDYNVSLIDHKNETVLTAFSIYKNKTDSQNYLVQRKNNGMINVFQIVNFNGEQNYNSESEESNKVWIAGVVIGILAALILIGILIDVLLK